MNRSDNDDNIHVGSDRPFVSRVSRIGARENSLPRQNRQHSMLIHRTRSPTTTPFFVRQTESRSAVRTLHTPGPTPMTRASSPCCRRRVERFPSFLRASSFVRLSRAE